MSKPRGTLVDGAGKGEGWHAADLFWQQFRAGEDVVVEDDFGRFHVGRLERPAKDDGVRVSVASRKSLIPWEEITFVAHAGFPVRAIRDMTPKEAERLAARFDTARARDEILRLLRTELGAAPYATLHGGCPFTFEDVEIVALNNPGNEGPRWWNRGEEEELVLVARDGAVCLSYNLGHLFYLETPTFRMGCAS